MPAGSAASSLAERPTSPPRPISCKRACARLPASTVDPVGPAETFADCAAMAALQTDDGTHSFLAFLSAAQEDDSSLDLQFA